MHHAFDAEIETHVSDVTRTRDVDVNLCLIENVRLTVTISNVIHDVHASNGVSELRGTLAVLVQPLRLSKKREKRSPDAVECRAACGNGQNGCAMYTSREVILFRNLPCDKAIIVP